VHCSQTGVQRFNGGPRKPKVRNDDLKSYRLEDDCSPWWTASLSVLDIASRARLDELHDTILRHRTHPVVANTYRAFSRESVAGLRRAPKPRVERYTGAGRPERYGGLGAASSSAPTYRLDFDRWGRASYRYRLQKWRRRDDHDRDDIVRSACPRGLWQASRGRAAATSRRTIDARPKRSDSHRFTRQ